VVTAVIATGIACTGPVRAAATAARATSPPGHSCSNPADAVLAIRVATNTPERVIKVGRGAFPDAIAATPNGKTAYVTLAGHDEVIPISVATNQPGRPVKVGVFPDAIAITPNGRTVYVGNGLVEQQPSSTPYNAVVPISTATNSAGPALLVAAGVKPAGSADGFAFSRDGKTAYVAVGGTDEVDPIGVASGSLGPAIRAGHDPGPIVITPDGRTAYVADPGSDTVTPVSTATGRPGQAISVGDGIDTIAITPDGKTAYAASINAGAVTPIRVATNTAARPIAVGTDLGPTTMAITPNGATAYVAAAATCATPVTPAMSATSASGR
jgi:DNA-binding beta-propeller fold protein YncE